MTDLDRQLREYIDAAAAPVTLDEVVRPAKQPSPWRARPWLALAAGAAAVLIPAIVIISIARLTPSDTTIEPGTTIAPPTTDSVTSTTVVTTTTVDTTAAPVDLVVPPGGIEGEFVVATWQGLSEHDRDQSPNMLATFVAPALEGPAVASDRNGRVYLATDGIIQYFAPGTGGPTTLPIHPDARPTVSRSLVNTTIGGADVLLHFGDTEEDFYGYDLTANEPWREGVAAAFADGTFRMVGDRFATLTDAEGNDLRPEDRGTVDVYLNVGTESAFTQLKVSTAFERDVTIHDFDGRRVLFSRKRAEPAGANATYVLIDFQCEGFFGCVLAMVDQPGTAALSRWVPPIGQDSSSLFNLDGCSAAGTSESLLNDDPSLPEALQMTRSRMLFLAASCNIADLHLLAQEDGATIILTQGYVDGIAGAELFGFDALASIVRLFQDEPAVGADGTRYWPAASDPSIDWTNLSDAELEDLFASHDNELEIVDSVEFGLFTGLRIEIDADGRWTFFGRPLT